MASRGDEKSDSKTHKSKNSKNTNKKEDRKSKNSKNANKNEDKKSNKINNLKEANKRNCSKNKEIKTNNNDKYKINGKSNQNNEYEINENDNENKSNIYLNKYSNNYQHNSNNNIIPLGHFYHIENMPVAVPNSNSFYRNEKNNRYGEYDDIKSINSNYNNNYNNQYQAFSRQKNFGEHNNIYEYINKLEQRNKRLENINNIFLNMIREQRESNYKRNLMRNHSMENISPGSYPYLSYDKYGNKNLVYIDKDSVNNNKIINGNYKEKYLVPLFPKNNSVADNNKNIYLLNNEKIKLFRKDLPYFNYENNKYSLYKNIPQKVNSVQYINKQAIYKSFNSNEKDINVNINKSKNNNNNNEPIKIITHRKNNSNILNEINRMSNNLNKRLKRIENSQIAQKKDIDFLMGKTKKKTDSKKSNNKIKKSSSIKIKTSSDKKSKSNKESKKENTKISNKENKKEEKKESKKYEDKEEEVVVVEDSSNDKEDETKNKDCDKDDNEESADEDDEEEDDENEENEKEIAIKSFNSEEDSNKKSF